MKSPRITVDPGYHLRDVEPHRGRVLVVLGLVSLIAVILGPVVIWLARSDLRKIDRGDMDPDGRHLTRMARNLGFAAIWILSAGIAAAAAVWFATLIHAITHPR